MYHIKLTSPPCPHAKQTKCTIVSPALQMITKLKQHPPPEPLHQHYSHSEYAPKVYFANDVSRLASSNRKKTNLPLISPRTPHVHIVSVSSGEWLRWIRHSPCRARRREVGEDRCRSYGGNSSHLRINGKHSSSRRLVIMPGVLQTSRTVQFFAPPAAWPPPEQPCLYRGNFSRLQAQIRWQEVLAVLNFFHWSVEVLLTVLSILILKDIPVGIFLSRGVPRLDHSRQQC